MIGLDVHSEIGAAIEAVGETPQRVRPAVRRALRQTGTKMWRPVRAEAAKRANVPARALSRRVFRSLRRERDALSIWFGTYNVALSKLGTARQTGTGVKVGRRFFPGAFLGRGKLAGRGVFIRYGSPHFDPDLYTKPKRPRPDSLARAKGVDIGEAVEASFAANESGFQRYFAAAFRLELAK